MLAACASGGGQGESSAPALPQTYVVRPHDTLYTIAWRHNLDYRQVAKWNNIGADYKLVIGQVLILHPARRVTAARTAVPEAARNAASPTLRAPLGSSANAAPPAPRPPVDGTANAASQTLRPPPADAANDAFSTLRAPGEGPRVGESMPLGDALRAGSTPGAAATAQAPVAMPDTAPAPSPAVTPVSAPPVESRPRDAAASKAMSAAGNIKWVWPTDRLSAPRPVPGGGILLLGKLGQDIRAAGSGRVVYTGSGLRGYGNLIIIKHGESLLSSYAHNRELLVHEGQDVAMGQVIARMGTGPHRVCALYFEIRVNGKPADPLRFLASDR